MAYYKFIGLIFLFLVFGCKKEAQRDSSTLTNQKSDSLNIAIAKKDINTIKYTDYILSDTPFKIAEGWIKYKELETNIDALKEAKLNFFKDDVTILKTFYNDLKTSIPEPFNAPEVTTRISALENASYNLYSSLAIENLPKAQVLPLIQEVLTGMSNLKLQMNKKIERESQKIEKP